MNGVPWAGAAVGLVPSSPDGAPQSAEYRAGRDGGGGGGSGAR